MKFKKHQCIEVHNQYGIERFECESFVEAAMADGYDTWDYTIINDMEDAETLYGDEIPAEVTSILATGEAAVAVYCPCSNTEDFMPLSKFDAEDEAFDYLAHDLNRLIVIDSTEDAKEIAENYRGHEDIKVRCEAERILREVEDGFIETED